MYVYFSISTLSVIFLMAYSKSKVEAENVHLIK